MSEAKTYGPDTLSAAERDLADRALEASLKAGADGVRISLSKSTLNQHCLLCGQLDKVSRAADRTLTLSLFLDGRFGTFSTNRVGASLEAFIARAVATVRTMSEDPCRGLADPSHTAKNARTGREAGLFDPAWNGPEPDRTALARKVSLWEELRRETPERAWKAVSEECDWSDCLSDNYLIDSNGLCCRHLETSFEVSSEITLQDSEGRRYSGYAWDSMPRRADVVPELCGRKALERAVAQLHPQPCRGGRMTVVFDTEIAGRLVKPLLSALGGYALQQRNSFLQDSLGKQLFPEYMTLLDRPHAFGQNGARLYDSEGSATADRPIIDRGRVSLYFLNSYTARKMGLAPTVEDATKATLLPCLDGNLLPQGQSLTQEDILRHCGDGLLVTGFNGGNCSGTTGAFSYGAEGFLFRDGRILHPVRELVVTGEMTGLWNRLLAAGTDARPCSIQQIPTLAFSDVHVAGADAPQND